MRTRELSFEELKAHPEVITDLLSGNDNVPILIERRGENVRFEEAPPKVRPETFRELVREWRQATRYVSSLTDMVTHPAYQRIIGMGTPVLPYLLAELEQEPHHWFWALKAITGEEPVVEDARGNLNAMTEAWLAWGRERGYC